MNADAIRYLYGYHFAENHRLWDDLVLPLSDENFTREVDYSVGSIQSQILHLLNVDHAWFLELRAEPFTEFLTPADLPNRQAIRVQWDLVEAKMKEYLAKLEDETLFTQPLEGEDEALYVWQVLIHVINHGTDHRAQILRSLHDFGIKTHGQDLDDYLYTHP